MRAVGAWVGIISSLLMSAPSLYRSYHSVYSTWLENDNDKLRKRQTGVYHRFYDLRIAFVVALLA